MSAAGDGGEVYIADVDWLHTIRTEGMDYVAQLSSHTLIPHLSPRAAPTSTNSSPKPNHPATMSTFPTLPPVNPLTAPEATLQTSTRSRGRTRTC